MGSAHPTRLSFLRQMLRRVAREKWRFSRALWQVDDHGVGRAVYHAIGPERTYSLVAFAHDLPDDMRSDRVIATAWDATFTLFDGVPSDTDLERLQANVPLQEAGRIGESELTLARANRSVRVFEHVVSSLAAGHQPDRDVIERVGYLMRTSAVYGSGKFGASDRDRIAERSEFAAPFQPEMLTVWLIREFTFDIVDHLARVRGGAKACRLSAGLRRVLGVGNSTGLGMVWFLIRHPELLNNWIAAREIALARVRSLAAANDRAIRGFKNALRAMITNAATWHSEHPMQASKIQQLRVDLMQIQQWIDAWDWSSAQPWERLWQQGGSQLSMEGQEALLALLIEPHGDLVDDLGPAMSAVEQPIPRLDGSRTVAQTRRLLETNYGWALAIDFQQPETQERFWYVSQEKLEPRVGARYDEEGAQREQPFDIARRARALYDALASEQDATLLADVLLRHPEYRYIARRAQLSAVAPYAEIRDNLLASNVLPIDMMRCKLAFFGASHFDPRSDKWVRISLFHGESSPHGLGVTDEVRS